MQLVSHAIEQQTSKRGNAVFTMLASEELKIETSPGGVEILDAKCPEGKIWNVKINVKIQEMDA